MTVYKRGKIWYYEFVMNKQRYRGSTGKTRERDAKAYEKQEKARVAAQQESERHERVQKEIQKNAGMTLSQALDRVWKELWCRNRDGEKAFNRVFWICQNYGDPLLEEITASWISTVKSSLYSEKRVKKPATVNRYLANLKTILHKARDEWEVLIRIPKIKMDAENNERTRVITPDERQKLVETLKNSTNKKRSYDKDVADLVDFLCETGLRLSEALTLDNKCFQIEGALQVFPVNSKNKKPRTVPLTRQAKEIIDRRGHKPFANLDPFKCNRAFNWAKEQIGIHEEEFCIHACRHTYASRNLEKGNDLMTVKELLGHSSYQTTQRYSHLATEHLRQAVRRLDE